ncbi:MAG: tRNA 2-thiouridine(34) synthase MnmA [Chloroflexota bacterium]
MATRQRVVVAMSGGVDSSVAAALLAEQGCEVIGVMLRLWEDGWTEETPAGNRCCSLDAVEDARRVAQQFGFPFYVVNAEADFKRWVVDYFLAEYARGRTPNPCTACNQHIKFGFLLTRAAMLDADALATGHYARLAAQADGSYALLRAVDRAKDQSYMLYMLGQDRLSRLRFPLGELTKTRVRAEAGRLGLGLAHKPDSQEICFVGRDYRDFLARHIPEALRPGSIVDEEGVVLGQHAGLPRYTIGQRQGLNLARRERTYVLGLDAGHNALRVGGADGLLTRHAVVRQVTFSQPRPERALARIRSHGELAACSLAQSDEAGDALNVTFDEPQRALSPGQVMVFYDGDVVLGGGIIE